MDAPSNVVEALAAVMAELPGIAKVKHENPSGKGLTYAYRGIEEITSEVQGLFAKYGIVVVPRVARREVKDIVVNNNDWTDTYLEVSWTVYGPGMTSVDASTFGHGRDNSDKGTNKAMTQAFKYLLLDMLCISDPADDNDGTNVEGTRRPPASQPLYEDVNGEQIPMGFADNQITHSGPPSALATSKQVGYIKKLLEDGGYAPSEHAALVNEKCPPWPDNLNNLSKEQASTLITLLK